MSKKDLIKRADGSYSPRGLWDNIRANAGSGKKPSKEMLAQEKKINNEMANGGKMSSFKASNIQTYAAGGPIKPPKWSLNYNPYSYNAANLVGGYEGYGNLASQNLGISTPDLLGRERKVNATKFPFSASIGLMNDRNLTNDSSSFASYGETEAATGQQLTAEEILASKTMPYNNGIPLDANISLGIQGSGINPNMKKRSQLGAQLEAGYNPTSGLYGQLNSTQKWALGNDYTNPLNRTGEWRVEPSLSPLNFQIAQKPGDTPEDQDYEAYLQNNIATGTPYNHSDPNNPVIDTGKEDQLYVSSAAGIGGQVKLPIGMLHGDIGVSRNWEATQGQKYTPTANVGYTLPLSELSKIGSKLPKINLPERSPFKSMSAANETGTEENNNLQENTGQSQESYGKVNASPIHKRWQPEAEDIFIDWKNQPIQEPFTYDPTTGESQPTETMNNYSKGGQVHINFANGGSFNNKGFQSLPANVQAKIKSNSFAGGGQLTEFNAGGTHEESPIGGIPQGIAPDGKMNLVEEGETKLNAADYVFSDQIKIDKETATLFGLPKGDIGKTFADVSKKANRPNSRRDNDTIEQVAIQRDLENLMQAQEKQKEMQKDKDVAEFAAKYPDLAQNIPVPGQEQQMAQEQMQPNAMQQGMMQEQMAPPADMPQQMVDPAMMAQQGQLPMSYGGSIFNCGGKMYNDGGHMYGIGGNVMRGIGAGAYGIGEGLLDTLTFGLTDNLTDKGFDKLAGIGGRSESEVEKDRMIRGFGNTAGAIGGAALTGGAATSAAIGEGAEGLASGASNIKGTGEKFDKIAGGIGQGVSMAAGFMGPQGATQAAGVMKGNEAVNKLMAAKQNPFINQATNFASSAMNSFAQGGRIPYSMYQPLDHVTQYGGNLNMPTNDHPYLNYLAMGGPEGETPANPTNPTLAFNLNGIVANYTLEQALADPLVLEAFGAESDEDGNLLKAPNLEEVKKAIATRFQEEAIDNRTKVGIAQSEYDAALNAAAIAEAPLPGETKEQYDKRMSDLKAMNPKLDPKATISEIKQTPLQGALMALPAAYNIGRGLFEKAAVLDYNDYAQKANIDPYTMNIDPQVAEVRNAYAGAAQAIKNASPGGGAYLANMGNIAAGKQEAMNELYTKKEMFDKEAKFKTDLINKETKDKNLALAMQIQTYNDAAKAAKMKSLQEGLGQLADIATNDQGIDVQTQYLKAISPEFAEKFKYSSIFDQLQAAAKAKKASKKSGK